MGDVSRMRKGTDPTLVHLKRHGKRDRWRAGASVVHTQEAPPSASSWLAPIWPAGELLHLVLLLLLLESARDGTRLELETMTLWGVGRMADDAIDS